MGGAKVLLIKQKGEFSAIAPKCTHYGAPLVKGCLGQGRIRCPWHGACFNIKTGDIEDFPGLDSLQTYKVRRMKRWCKVQCIICMYSPAGSGGGRKCRREGGQKGILDYLL